VDYARGWKAEKMAEIKFGTSGWRGVISEDFTLENVRLVSRSIAKYLKSGIAEGSGRAVVGFDTRFMSEVFAEQASRQLCEEGLEVLQSTSHLPTPAVSYEIQRLKADGGINITASHNPYLYNGIKFSPSSGAPASEEVTARIEKLISKLQDEGDPLETHCEPERVSMGEQYLSDLADLINLDAIADSTPNVLVNPLFGAACGFLDRVLENREIPFGIMNDTRDPLFGGGTPEPSSSSLRSMLSRMKDEDYTLGLATDGDADRFGIVDDGGVLLTANEVLPVLALHLIKTRGTDGKIVRTVATTRMLDRIAERHGIELVEVPVGFKHIGRLMLQGDVLIGCEESGGMSIKGWLPEKDGILACLLALEVVAMEGRSFRELREEIQKDFGRMVSARLDIAASQRIMNKVKDTPFDSMSEFLEKKVCKSSEQFGKLAEFEDGSWVLLRPSGTEPVVRIYFEAEDDSAISKLTSKVRDFLGIGK
jgi:alpha-D-glucose phosphate-specific phosphoglucomutase